MANRRAAEIDTFSGVPGAGRLAVRAIESRPAAAPTTLPAVATASPVASRAVSSSIPGRPTASPTASSTSCTLPGSGRGIHSCSATCRGWADTSSMTCPMSNALMPSTIAWWVLVSTAVRPLARPSTRYISQSGRVWSSGRDISRPTSSVSCASEPGLGNAERRTWYATSKSGSSTQTGRARLPGTWRTFCRYRGTRAIRCSISSTRPS